MMLLFKGVHSAPEKYTFDGEKVTAWVGEEKSTFDLSSFPSGAVYSGADRVSGIRAIRDVKRDADGMLWVTLAQPVVSGKYPGRRADWRGLVWIESSEYAADKCFVTPTGMKGVEDYRVELGVGIDSRVGWTVVKEV